MKSFRLGAACICAGALTVLACSSDDTIVALNVQSTADVGFVSKLHVTITQGSASLEKDFTMVPTREVTSDADGMGGEPPVKETVISDAFYERITLPGSFSDGEASLDLQSFDKVGEPLLHPAPVSFSVRENGATAVFVKLTNTPVTPAGGAGGGGSGGAATGGTAAGGAASGGTGGAPDAAGAGGV